MADRAQQYNMVPQGFGTMLQQQHAQQQAQQQQQLQQQQAGQQQPQPDSHSGPGFPALWQQQQQQSMQQQFRPRSGAGVGSSQAQMNELMRSQNMARVASGQPMPFGMAGGMPNMGGQQPFHDPSSNQSANGNMPGGGFPNLGGMMNQGMNPAQAQQQRGNPLANLPHQRQLEMIMAHNNQNNPFAKFPQNQISQRPDQPQQHPNQPPFLNPGMNHASPGDIFSPGMSNDPRRGSPSNPPNSMPGLPPNMAGSSQLAHAHERANQVRMSIQNDENMVNQLKLKAQRIGTITEEDKMQHAKLMSVVNQKKEYLAKLVTMIQQGSSIPPQLTGGGNGGPGPGWNGQGGNGTPFDQNIQRNATPMQPSQHPQGPPTGPLQGGNPGMSKPQTPLNQQAGLPQNQQQLTPQQHPGVPRMGPPQGGNGGGPIPTGAMGGQPVFQQPMNGPGRSTPQMPGAGGSGMASNSGQGWQPQPLERGPFERTLKSFFQQRHFVLDPASLVIDSRPVDLYLLHRTVFEMGGFCKIEGNNTWDVVGGKLGFVNFPGSDGQPPRSGPGISLQITQYYKDYVQAFDAAYLRTMLESRIKVGTGQQELTEQHRNQALTMVRNFTGFDLARMQHPQKMSEQQMSQLVNFAHRTVADLRSMNVPENVIQMVEARRSDLQRLYQDQVNFKGMVAQNGGAMRPGQPQSLMQNGGGGPGGMGGRPMQPPFGAAAGGLPGQMQQRMLAQGGMPNAQGNFMDGRMQGQPGMQMGGIGPPLPQHQQVGPMQQRMISGMPGHVAGGQFHATIPTKEQTQSALVNLAKLRREATEAIHHLQPIEIPPDQRAAYNSLLESVHRMTLDFDPKLPILYSLIKNDDHIRRIVKIISTVQYQRTLCSQSNPRIIISLDALRASQSELVRLNDAFSLAMKQADAMRQNHGPQPQHFMQGHPQQSQIQSAIQHQMLQQQGMNNMSPPGGQLQDHGRPHMPGQQHPPSAVPHPQGQPQQTTPNLAAQQLRPPTMSLNPPPPRRQKQPGSAMTPGAMQSPSPAPAASTPPNAPTPSAMVSSPAQAPKSPKAKAPPKAKPAPSASKRRSSKVAPSPAATAPTPQSQASPEASTSTPIQAHASVKRQREEDAAPSPGPANGPSPPKRVKMEEVQSTSSQAQQKAPEAGPSAPVKKEELSSEIAHIKTGEDASQFLDQMTELIKYAADGASSQSADTLSGNISDTLELLLKGCGPADTGADGGSSYSRFGDMSAPARDGTPPPASLFDEFFDFSNVGEEEDSKVDTPDLISSSSTTNPSPESNASEVSDPHHHQFQHQFGVSTSGGKPGFDDVSDVVRLGHWKEIDGGEAAYYQPSDWKWEGQMATVDAPWAIYGQ